MGETIIKLNIMDFFRLGGNANVIVMGSTGHGKCVSDTLVKKHLLNNNYRKSHGLPLVRKGHPAYRMIKRYKWALRR